MLETVNTASTALARKFSHDLRNAFNCIRLCTSAINICPEVDEKVEMLGEIELAAERAMLLLDALADDSAGYSDAASPILVPSVEKIAG